MDRLEGRMDELESRFDRLEVKVSAVEKKVDGVAADLSARTELKADIAKVEQRVTMVVVDHAAHRRHTEAHRKGWRVSEGD